MAIKKKSQNLKESMKKTTTSTSKTLATPQVKVDKTKRQAGGKGAKKLVHKMSHSVESMLIEQAEKKVPNGKEHGANRFRATDKKTVVESIGLLAEEIRIYMEENEEIGVSKMLGVMKGRENSEAMTFAAMGWLIRDGKIVISPDGKKVSLQ